MVGKFITGFNRDRDDYQVPLALAEVDALGSLVTDYYYGVSRPSVGRLSHRKEPNIPATLVRSTPSAFYPQLGYEVGRKFVKQLRFPAGIVDERIARRLEREVELSPGSPLLIYSSYAHLAFKATQSDVRALFQFHPGRNAVMRALEQDEGSGLDDEGWRPEQEEVGAKRARDYDSELQFSTQCIVASSFMRDCMIEDGYSPANLAVAPYGCPKPLSGVPLRKTKTIVFLGQGVRRKGLHNLLEAWSTIAHSGYRLLIISNYIEPKICDKLSASTDVDVEAGLSNLAVRDRLRAADALVLPSLLEGFGLVLGEALASGCRLIASTNTGLKDLVPADVPWAREVGAGSVNDLRRALMETVDDVEPGDIDRTKILECAERNSWARFRSDVRTAVSLPRSPKHGEPM